MPKIKRYRYCGLPDGNATEFPWLDQELRAREVAAEYLDLESGGRCYRIPEKDMRKMPKDTRGHYLGDDNQGYSIYKTDPKFWEDLSTDEEWRKV